MESLSRLILNLDPLDCPLLFVGVDHVVDVESTFRVYELD